MEFLMPNGPKFPDHKKEREERNQEAEEQLVEIETENERLIKIREELERQKIKYAKEKAERNTEIVENELE